MKHDDFHAKPKPLSSRSLRDDVRQLAAELAVDLSEKNQA